MVKKNCCFVDVRLRAEVEDLQGKCKEKTKVQRVNKDPRRWTILPLDHTLFPCRQAVEEEAVLVFQLGSPVPQGSAGPQQQQQNHNCTEPVLFHTDLRLSPSQRFMFTSRQGEENPRRRHPSSLDAFLRLLFLNGAEHPELSSSLNRCILNSDPIAATGSDQQGFISSSPSR